MFYETETASFHFPLLTDDCIALGCTDTEQPDPPDTEPPVEMIDITKNGESAYRIIRADRLDSDSFSMKAAMKLRDAIRSRRRPASVAP